MNICVERTTIHEDMCGKGRVYMKICLEKDDYTVQWARKVYAAVAEK